MAEISHLLEIKDNLQSYKDPKGTLKTLNTILEAASSNTEILQIASVINPHMVFLYFTSEHDTFKVWDISCNILSKMLGAFPVVEIIKMSQELELGLQHAYDGVRVLCTKLLWYKLSSFQSLSSLLLQSTMFHLITQLIGDSCLESSQNVSNIIECLFNNEDSVLIITSTELGRSFLLDLQGLAESSDINRFRVYDLVVRLTKGSEMAFQFVCASGFINCLIGELESKDVLLKLNCLELLQALTETCRGMELVDSADVLKKLHALLSSTNDDPFGAILIPGILKFFGCYCQIATVVPTVVCSQYPLFLQSVFHAVCCPEDETMWPVATDTVGLLSSSLQGREALIQQGIEATPVLPKLAEFVSQPKNDVRLRALRTFSQVFSCDNEEGTYDVSLSIGYRWYKLANVDLVTLVVAIIKQPFPDLHLVGLKFLLSLCQWKWGQMEMQRSPGFVEFLLDRRTETEKEGKELKYYIIRCLSESSFTERIFGSSLLLKFKDYVNEGPFYVKVETVVAFEDV